MYDESSFASGVTLTSDKVACLAKQKAIIHVARRLIFNTGEVGIICTLSGCVLKKP
jgi:hypothetical protein